MITVLMAAVVFLPAGYSGGRVRAQNPPKAGQNQAPQTGQQPIRVQVALVNLFATVRDNHKQVITNLEKENFHVTEDGVEQKIDFFRKETDQPITIGILMDTSGSMENIIGPEQEAASRFLQRVLKAKDLAMIMSFDVDVNLLSDFTNDSDKLERALRRARVNAPGVGMINPGPIPQRGGGTNMYDAIYLGCREKLSRETGRRALILITDAEDTGSRVKLQEALETAQRSDVVLHFLVIIDRRFGGNEGVAHKMAEETGGRSIDVRNEKDLQKAFGEISEELRTQYTLGYYPTNPARDGTFRRIKVDVPGRDAKILARRGYYAPRD